ncbi:MAG: (2Fe-2S)-binding protein [Defluviitaleaceae bacterium]|nr:(2Fe-2S)-binding protein [Defluviitaleaceae bacterium]
MRKLINIEVNGKAREVAVDVRASLLEVLRGELELTGSKKGCGVGECGACTVLMDGVAVNSCISLAVWADGRKVTTIEGVSPEPGKLSDVQQSFVDSGAVQCGFCTPGLVMAATALLGEQPSPSREEIRRGLSGNLCRCTGYSTIIDAVENVAKTRGQA